MSGTLKFLLDTNSAIYMLNGNLCMQPYLKENLAISFISEIELYPFKEITEEEEKTIEEFIKNCKLFEIDKSIIKQAIHIRQNYHNKLGDAIIAATAIVNNLTLLTADKGFNKIKELNMILLQP